MIFVDTHDSCVHLGICLAICFLTKERRGNTYVSVHLGLVSFPQEGFLSSCQRKRGNKVTSALSALISAANTNAHVQLMETLIKVVPTQRSTKTRAGQSTFDLGDRVAI